MRKNGFTLIELLTAIAIVSLFLAMVIPNYRTSQNEKALDFGVYQIKDDIRTVQSYSNNLKKFDNTFPKGGYGIHFLRNSDSYIIFADVSNFKIYDGASEEVRVVKLPNNVKTTDLASNSFDLVFEPPYGTIYRDGNNSFTIAEIVIGLDSGSSKTIKITSSGALE